jgi:hypothetical protein
MQTGELSNERIRSAARVVGIRTSGAPTLENVERRRLQLWGLTVVLFLAVSVGVAVVSVMPAVPAAGPTQTIMRVGLVLAAVGFGVYAIEKELHLRRLGRLLTDHEVRTAGLERRIEEMQLLLEAGKAMNSELELPAVLDTMLRSALDLLSGASGSILLLQEEDELVAVLARGEHAAVGERVRVGTGVAGRVAATREPLLLEGRIDRAGGDTHASRPDVMSVVSVPLVSRNMLFGVLSIHAPSDHRYTDYDLQTASLLAEHAAGALANARRYEIERMHRTHGSAGEPVPTGSERSRRA